MPPFWHCCPFLSLIFKLIWRVEDSFTLSASAGVFFIFLFLDRQTALQAVSSTLVLDRRGNQGTPHQRQRCRQSII